MVTLVYTDAMTHVVLKWRDATQHGHRQLTREEFDKGEEQTLSPGISSGWLVREDEESITLAADCFWDNGDVAFRGVSSYPKVCVLKEVRSAWEWDTTQRLPPRSQ